MLILLTLIATLLAAACGRTTAPTSTALTAATGGDPAGTAKAGLDAGEHKAVILATTTSTRDSGLLDVLIPAFEQQTGYTVKPIAVGTGEALKLGEQGNADVLLVHAPASEQEFMQSGAGTHRTLVMHNDFVLVGPQSDPAHVQEQKTTSAALERIASGAALFYSRGDDSGTHKKELALWAATGADKPQDSWYRETGTGMGPTLRVASEKRGYTLTDRATYLAQRDTLDLRILLEGDPALLNIYHAIQVNPARFPKVNARGARAWIDFLVAPRTQQTIGEFGRAELGQPLFVPDAGKAEDTVGP